MMNLFRWLMWALSKPFFGVRYKVEHCGFEEIKGLKQTLILPNHPAYMDPPLVIQAMWPVLKPRPMLSARALSHPLISWIPKALDAVEIPELDQASTQARQQAEDAIDGLIESLHKGDNVILWPSGHLSSTGKENLASSRSLTTILQRVPDANIVLIRTEGLWGSRFSFAASGEHPHMVSTMLKGIPIVLANLLFFTPRRKVTITAHKLEKGELPELEREKVNRFFEDWYNSGSPAKPIFVPYHFAFGPRTHEFPPLQTRSAGADIKAKPETKKLVHEAFEQKLGRKIPENLQESMTDLDTLGLDSLDRMELTLLIEQQSGFTSQQVPVTLGDLYALAQGVADSAPITPPPAAWFAESSSVEIALLDETIPHAFIRRVMANRKDIAVADDVSGALTYEKFLVAAITISRRLAKIPGKNVAVMLPASAGADIVLIALHLAGKLPVMINWTTGPSNIDHAIKVMEVTHVVTSQQFMDRVGIEIPNIQFMYMEEIRKDIGKIELLRTLFRVRFAGQTIYHMLPKVSPDDPAVVLFTSGSEKAPKAVPLTHANILGNLKSVIDSFDLTSKDSMLGFLPPFHSFGMSVTSLFPILAALKVIHHPDPTAAGTLAKKIGAYKATVVCGTPTFVGYILARATPEDVASVRLWVVGAEKCPPKVFEKVRAMTPNAAIVEGYGITECSPLISVNRVEKNKPGTIGLPLPGVEVMVTDIDTLEPVGRNAQGMLLVHGVNVFPGYISHDGPQPFHEHDGKKWYITGDLGELDDDGFVTFRGRLKRFIKAGGEMISLPAIEEPLSQEYPASDEGPQVAVEGIEHDHGRRIVLFTTRDITITQANALLASKGMTGVMRLDAVNKINAIPMLGTGKTDYKQLRKIIEDELAAK